MKKASRVLFALSCLAVSQGSVAEAAARKLATPLPDRTSEFRSSEPTSSRFEVSGLSSGALFFTGSGHVGLLAAGVAYQVAPGIQAALTAIYLRVGDSKNNLWGAGALIGPVFNFPFQTDLRDTFFASLKYGGGKIGGSIVSDSLNNDTSRGMWAISTGKRFKITESISYSPEVGASKVVGGSTSTDTLYRISPLAFSLMF